MSGDPGLPELRRTGRITKPTAPTNTMGRTPANKKTNSQSAELIERLSGAISAEDQIRAAVETNMTAVAAEIKPWVESLSAQLSKVVQTLEVHKTEAVIRAAELMMKLNQANVQIEKISVEIKQQGEELQAFRRHHLAAVLTSQPSPTQQPTQKSYAGVILRPALQPSNAVAAKVLKLTDTSYCTIDTSRVEEADKENTHPGIIREIVEQNMRSRDSMKSWRCVAVTKDMRSAGRVRITCRNEEELKMVREIAEKKLARGTRILRDQLHPVKIDNANKLAVLDSDGTVLPNAAEVLGKENNVSIAKTSWISKKDNHKAYGSMIIYLNKANDAAKLPDDQYFDVRGESASTRVCEPRKGPVQCYKCQSMGHKAFSCTNAQICGKCAKAGHHHSECIQSIPKCVPCGGPHESYSKNCRVTHPSTSL
jgi:hypothetical protein